MSLDYLVDTNQCNDYTQTLKKVNKAIYSTTELIILKQKYKAHPEIGIDKIQKKLDKLAQHNNVFSNLKQHYTPDIEIYEWGFSDFANNFADSVVEEIIEKEYQIQDTELRDCFRTYTRDSIWRIMQITAEKDNEPTENETFIFQNHFSLFTRIAFTFAVATGIGLINLPGFNGIDISEDYATRVLLFDAMLMTAGVYLAHKTAKYFARKKLSLEIFRSFNSLDFHEKYLNKNT